jgi:hypothetical protein
MVLGLTLTGGFATQTGFFCSAGGMGPGSGLGRWPCVAACKQKVSSCSGPSNGRHTASRALLGARLARRRLERLVGRAQNTAALSGSDPGPIPPGPGPRRDVSAMGALDSPEPGEATPSSASTFS